MDTLVSPFLPEASAAQASGSIQSRHASKTERARQAAEAFEAMFIAQMLEPMFDGLSASPPFGGGHGEDIYRSMMIDEMAKATVRKGGIGIADHVMKHMLRQQESP